MMRRRGADTLRTLLDLEPDAAVLELLLVDLVALLARLDPGFLDGVGLQEEVEVLLVAPGALEVVELDGAGGGVDDGRVLPAR
jgi:hypothetical protein